MNRTSVIPRTGARVRFEKPNTPTYSNRTPNRTPAEREPNIEPSTARTEHAHAHEPNTAATLGGTRHTQNARVPRPRPSGSLTYNKQMNCPTCGKPTSGSGVGRPPLYDSVECRTEMSLRRRELAALEDELEEAKVRLREERWRPGREEFWAGTIRMIEARIAAERPRVVPAYRAESFSRTGVTSARQPECLSRETRSGSRTPMRSTSATRPPRGSAA
jgi:hypothetical protein